MKKVIKRWFKNLIDEADGFLWAIGLRSGIERLAVGLMLTLELLLLCGIGGSLS